MNTALNLSRVRDFANRADDEILRYEFPFYLHPSYMSRRDYVIPELSWDCVRYGESDVSKIPNDKRGIYAFSIGFRNKILPPHGYVFYIGIAGVSRSRSLKARYKDYLSQNKLLKRPKIARVFGKWAEVITFCFAPVEDDLSLADLKTMEKQLNAALLPPCSQRDIEGEIRHLRRAF